MSVVWAICKHFANSLEFVSQRDVNFSNHLQEKNWKFRDSSVNYVVISVIVVLLKCGVSRVWVKETAGWLESWRLTGSFFRWMNEFWKINMIFFIYKGGISFWCLSHRCLTTFLVLKNLSLRILLNALKK